MAGTGDQLKMMDGTTFLLVQSAQDTGGERVEFEITLPAGGLSPPPHFHPRQTEEWDVLAGTLSAQIDGSWRELRAGESLVMPPGRVHTLRNRTNDVVRVRDVHVPAGDFQEYVETLHRLSQAGKLKNLRHIPTLIHLTMVVSDHRRRQGQVTASRAQRIAESILASLGRLLGYKVV